MGWKLLNEVYVSFMEAPIDNNTAFLAGGADGFSRSGPDREMGNRTSYCASYFLDLTTKVWTPLPNMTHCRYFHSCNLVKNETSGSSEIVVVGGMDERVPDHCAWIQPVEIFNLDTLQWRNGTAKSILMLNK